MQGLRQRLHARAPHRHVHGLQRGRLRGVLQLRPLRPRARGRMSTAASDREAKVLGIIETARAKRPKFRDDRVTMAHGAGGKATAALIEGLLTPAFASPALDVLGDGGLLEGAGAPLALAPASFVVKPIRFPGGSIGELAVNGTVNDLAMAGARAVGLSLSLILEEGLAADELRAEVDAVARAAAAADVAI